MKAAYERITQNTPAKSDNSATRLQERATECNQARNLQIGNYTSAIFMPVAYWE